MIGRSVVSHVSLMLAVALCTAIPASVAAVIQSLWSSMVVDIDKIVALNLVIGALPTAIYMVAPAACVVAICWIFWANSDSVALPAMYAAGMSVYACARPAILMGVAVAAVSAVDAWVVAPRGVALVEDVKYALRHNVSVGGLAEGRFHRLDYKGGEATISFRKHLGGNRFEGFFASVASDRGDGFSISARRAMIRKRDGKITITFEEGTRIAADSESKPAFVVFRSYAHIFPINGGTGGSERNKVTIPEMDLSQLLALSRSETARRKLIGVAKSEVAKRFFMPLMALAHSLLAIGILFSVGPVRTRLRRSHLQVAAGIITLHIALAIVVELVARLSFWVHGILAVLIVVEAIVGLLLLIRAGNTTRAIRWPRLRRPMGVRPVRRPAADTPS